MKVGDHVMKRAKEEKEKGRRRNDGEGAQHGFGSVERVLYTRCCSGPSACTPTSARSCCCSAASQTCGLREICWLRWSVATSHENYHRGRGRGEGIGVGRKPGPEDLCKFRARNHCQHCCRQAVHCREG